MSKSKGYNISFMIDGESTTIKIIAKSEENALAFFELFFPGSEVTSIEESIVKIVLTDLQPN